MQSFHASLAIVFAVVLTAGCGNAPKDQAKGAGGSGGAESTTPPPCPAGHVVQDDGSCLAIGIQGCAAKFVDADGICRPSMTKCADEPGTIPKFDTGCVPVGIPKADCAPEFWDAAEGLCRPTMAKCADKPGTFAVPSLGCVSIDGPNGCGVGTWGNIVDGPDVVYVDQNYAGPTSDGTKDKPFKTIADAVTAIPAGGTVAIAAGVYDEIVHIDKMLIIEGRCASMVRITGNGSTSGAVQVHAIGVVRNLTVGGSGPGVYVAPDCEAVVEHLHISEATGVAIQLDEAKSFAVRDTFIERTHPNPTTLSDGIGIDSSNTLSVLVERCALVKNRLTGLWITGAPTQSEVKNSLIDGTLPEASLGLLGAGITAGYGAAMNVYHTAVVANHNAGIIFHQSDGTVIESLVEGTLLEPASQKYGTGINLNTMATATISNNAIIGNYNAGVWLWQSSIAHTNGNLIARTNAMSNSRYGQGFWARASRIDSEDDVIYQNASAGVFAYDASVFEARRLLVENTLPHPETNQDGAGLAAYLASRLAIEDSAVMNNVVTGIGVGFGPVSDPSRIQTSIVSATKSGSAMEENGMLQTDFGDGIMVLNGDMNIEHTIVEKNARAGFFYYKSSGSVLQCEARENAVGINLLLSESVDFDPLKNSMYTLNKDDVQIDGEMAMPPQMTGE